MIKKFKLFEKIDASNIINIGSYAILKTGGKAFWNNYYGKIVNVGCDYSDDFYLVELLCDFDTGFSSQTFVPNIVYNNKTRNANTIWIHSDYVVIYKDEDEFKERVKEIEIEKNANKYNL